VTVVLDSSALIALARVGRLDLLRRITEVVHVPNAVFDEVVHKGAGRPGSSDVAQAQWIVRHEVHDLNSAEHFASRVGAARPKLSFSQKNWMRTSS
jgi:uncharacterized protein